VPQGAWRRFDASLYNPPNRTIRDYKELSFWGMQHKPLQPREKTSLEIIRLDVDAFEEVCAVGHIRKPPLADGAIKITVRCEEPPPQGFMKHLNITPYYGRFEQACWRRLYQLPVAIMGLFTP
jgi:hypothetical protein